MSCEYEDGRLTVHHQKEPSRIPFMKYMQKHLEKAYPEILTMYSEISSRRERLCKDIGKTMTSFIQYRPSFEKIILDKIESACPSLSMSEDTALEENNIYLPIFIFEKVFLMVSRGKTTINLNIWPNSKKNARILFYEHTRALAQGKPRVMKKLEHVIRKLVKDKDIIRRVQEYTELHKQLIDEKDLDDLREKIEDLHTFVHGGWPLAGYPVCELCDPPQIPN
jgi:hypothetical protein